MACKSCGTGGCGSVKASGAPAGCKSNGGCSSGGCNKMNVFDWLSNMDAPMVNRFDIVEVKFKGGRKEYFRNPNAINLHTGDPVVVEVQNGHHLGYVSLQGELVRLQMLKKKIPVNADVKDIYRIASAKDLEKHEQAIARELPTMYRAREIVHELNLGMKLSDVEFQADGVKAVFFYSSDERVDFRELIKRLAGEFKLRVEMKQISLRQEAGRLGGLGVCGRELCCSTWLTDFRNVTTSAARYQNLSLNPVKLSGQCGRLKCCLNYELETYIDALKDIPSLDAPLQTQKGPAFLNKTDIFRRLMWFGFKGEDAWHPIPVEQVKEIIALNKQGVVPPSLLQLTELVVEAPGPINSDLARMDKKYSDRSQRDRDQQRIKAKKKGGAGPTNAAPGVAPAQAALPKQAAPTPKPAAAKPAQSGPERSKDRPGGGGQGRRRR
ncbi:MAG: Signal peptidase-like protein [Sphingobacteriaceae bacterium]|nr:Signal peptidase-like protein [Cytophagaceae bacterium]